MKKTLPLWEKTSLKKIIDPSELQDTCKEIRQSGKTIASLNGSFDLLHAGHLQILYEASKVADTLIVALNSDESIKQYKGPSRPIIALRYRMQMMTALSFVDYVTWFKETDPLQVLTAIKPNIHVNGSEYGEDCIEAELVKSFGGEIHIVSLVPGLSTSSIIKNIQKQTD